MLESISLESPESVLSWASYSVFVFGPGVALGGVAVLARVITLESLEYVLSFSISVGWAGGSELCRAAIAPTQAKR